MISSSSSPSLSASSSFQKVLYSHFPAKSPIQMYYLLSYLANNPIQIYYLFCYSATCVHLLASASSASTSACSEIPPLPFLWCTLVIKGLSYLDHGLVFRVMFQSESGSLPGTALNVGILKHIPGKNLFNKSTAPAVILV